MPDRLIPANTTLLQPGSQYYRISDALAAIQVQAAQAGAVATAALQTKLDDLQARANILQAQIDTLNARLAAAGIP